MKITNKESGKGRRGERERATLQKLEMPVFELSRFFKFPRFGKFV